MRIGPAGNVSRREDVCDARLQIAIHRHTAVESQSRLFRELEIRTHSDARDDEIGGDLFAICESRIDARDACNRLSEVEMHSLSFVHALDEFSEWTTEHPFERQVLRRDHVHVEPSVSERGRCLEANEAGSDHHCTALSL